MGETIFYSETHAQHPGAHKQQFLHDKPISRVSKCLPPAGSALIFHFVIEIFSEQLSASRVKDPFNENAEIWRVGTGDLCYVITAWKGVFGLVGPGPQVCTEPSPFETKHQDWKT